MTTMQCARRLGAIVCLGFSVVLAGAGGDDGKAFKNTTNETKIFELTNAERKTEDVPLLKLSPELSKIARAHSENMARQGKMAHDLDGKTPFDRMRAAKFAYYYAGENVAKASGQFMMSSIMDGWMKSELHRKNILMKEFTEIGVGIARNADGEFYFTQLFAKPKKK